MEQLNRTLEGIKARGSAGFFIDGRWTAGRGSQILEVVAPHSEEVLLRYTEATPADIDVAVHAARNAFDAGPWPRLSAAQRAEVLNTVASNLEKRLPELTRQTRIAASMWHDEFAVVALPSTGWVSISECRSAASSSLVLDARGA
jgi:acyl-CoA reductase-like NAD-dependent aldehyde dehydrogenase